MSKRVCTFDVNGYSFLLGSRNGKLMTLTVISNGRRIYHGSWRTLKLRSMFNGASCAYVALFTNELLLRQPEQVYREFTDTVRHYPKLASCLVEAVDGLTKLTQC